MRTRRNFEEWEKAFIQLSYPSHTNKELSDFLHRSEGVIKGYASTINIKKKPKVIVGDVFGKLTVKSIKKGIWICSCECGNKSRCETNTLTSGHSKSCGCERIKSISTGYKNITGTWYGNIKRSATKRGFEFNVSKEFLDRLIESQNHKCVLSGMDIAISKRRSGKEYYKETTASLDRIDNDKGYEEDNVQFVHKHINYMKWTHDQSYFIQLCNKVSNNVRTT
jgi:hypothetical protein